MKLFLLYLSIYFLLFASDDVVGRTVDFNTEQLCDPDFIRYPENLISANKIDVNLDSTAELLLHAQFNNSSSFYLFYRADCGFKQVTTIQGYTLSFLSYASSSICQPIGCLALAYCAENEGQRELISVSGQHTLSPEKVHMWLDGNLPDADVTSQITITKYRLVDGKLIELESQVVANVLDNMELFRPNIRQEADQKTEQGFHIGSCK